MTYLHSGADLSECGNYRYRLWRCWDNDLPSCCFVMLNPSTADASEDDPTIRRCVGFAKREGCGMLVVVNLFARRTPYPKTLFKWRDEHGLDVVGNPANDVFIENEVKAAKVVIAAWGAKTKLRGRDKRVEALIRRASRDIHCLGTTAGGSPRHPVRLAKAAPLQLWSSP